MASKTTMTPKGPMKHAVVAQRAARHMACKCSSTVIGPAVSNPTTATKVRLLTRSDCELSVSVYPTFKYNAVGGGGWSTLTPIDAETWAVKFDTESLVIPTLSYRTASIFGLPIPPPLNIAIAPKRLEGTINHATGEVNLEFDAQFNFSAGFLYSAPPLLITTILTTESSSGEMKSATGTRMANGSARLVGVSRVPVVSDTFMDTFLMLPTDALAVLSAEFEFQ